MQLQPLGISRRGVVRGPARLHVGHNSSSGAAAGDARGAARVLGPSRARTMTRSRPASSSGSSTAARSASGSIWQPRPAASTWARRCRCVYAKLARESGGGRRRLGRRKGERAGELDRLLERERRARRLLARPLVFAERLDQGPLETATQLELG